MKSVMIFLAVLAMALVSVGSNSHSTVATAWAKPADVQNQRVTPAKTVKPYMKGTVKRPAARLEVHTPASTRGLHPGSVIYIGWSYAGERAPANAFHVWVKKGRNTWSLDLGSNNNTVVAAHAYWRVWRVPDPFPPGSDYYIRVRHNATGETAHSRFFTISE